MNEYATNIAFAASIFIFGIVAASIFVAWQIWKRLPAPTSYFLIALNTTIVSFLWLSLGSLTLFVFAFCSSCWGPGSPQERIHKMTFQLPLDGLRFILVASLLYVLSFLAILLFVRLKTRLLKLAVLISLAAIASGLVITIAVAKVNSNPDGVNLPILADAQQIKMETTPFIDTDHKTISYFTHSSPDSVFAYYEHTLQDDGWYSFYDNAGLTPNAPHNFSRRTSQGHELYLRVFATETAQHTTFVHIEPTANLNYVR